MFIMTFSLSSDYLIAQWNQTSGPEGGWIQCFTVKSGYIFAGTRSNGVYLSVDNGDSWQPANNGMYNSGTMALTVMDTFLFAGTNGAGVFRSLDNGGYWSNVWIGIPHKNIAALMVQDTNIFVGTWGGGVFCSSDYGNSWENVLSNQSVISFAVCDTHIFAGTADHGVFRSGKDGDSWTAINNGLPADLHVSSITVCNSVIIAGTWDGVYRSTNNVNNWLKVSAPWMDTGIETVAFCDPLLFAGSTLGMYRSADNGTSWESVNTGLTNRYINHITYTITVSDTHLFTGTWGGGAFRSSDCGSTWSAVNDGLTRAHILSLAVTDTNLYAGAEGGGVFLSNDDGDNWKSLRRNATVYSMAINGTNIYAGGNQYLIHSTNNGTSWNWIPLGSSQISSFAMKDFYLFVGTQGDGVYRTSDNCSTWDTVNTGLTNIIINALYFHNTDLFAGTEDGIYLSTDNGDNWVVSNQGLTNLNVYTITDIEDSLFAGTGDGVFLSTDNGANWNAFNSGLPSGAISSFAASDSGLFAITVDGIHFLKNSSADWISVNEDLQFSPLCLMASDVYLFAGTRGGGVWRRPLSEMYTLLEEYKSKPFLTFVLSQNYPNPFNPTTTIAFDLPKASNVSLKVYNILGEEVATLVSDRLSAGSYSYEWDASNLASGVYLYRLQAGDFVETRKMVVMR
jgi:ligand-binding sensor domain-containing protein